MSFSVGFSRMVGGGGICCVCNSHRDVRCIWRSERENIDCIIPTSASHFALDFEVIESFCMSMNGGTRHISPGLAGDEHSLQDCVLERRNPHIHPLPPSSGSVPRENCLL
jgi:hypothetical protein